MSRDHSQNHYGPNASFDGYDSDLASAGILIESLRKQVTRLRDAMEAAWQDGYAFCGAEGLSDVQKQFQAALAATEPKP